MPTVTIETASLRLSELIKDTCPGEEIIITQNDLPIATLTPMARAPREAGLAKHLPHFMSEDFDAIPEGFEEYL